MIFQKRTAVAFLLLSLLAVGCSGEDTKTDIETTNTGTESAVDTETVVTENALPDNLPDMDFGGATYTMYLRRDKNYTPDDFMAEEGSGDIVEDAVYRRNLTISERFNVQFAYNLDETGMTTSNTPGIIALRAGEHANDILALHGAHCFEYAKEGLLLDWFEMMSYNDLTQPWWDQDFRINTAIGGRLFSMTGSLSHFSIGGTFCMFFNKDILNRFDIDYPYQDVLDGTWTFDKYYSMSRAVVQDLNGNSVIEPEYDQYGLYTDAWRYPIAAFYMAGDKIITLDGDGVPTITVYSEQTEKIMESLLSYYKEPGVYITGKSGEYPENIFREGRALFIGTYTKDLAKYRDMDAEIGVIPYPKFDESTDRYYSLVDAGENVFAVPITATTANLDMISIVTEALAYEGYYSVLPTFYETALKTKYARDNESEEMLSIIASTRYFDYGYYDTGCTKGLAYIGLTMVDQSKNFASYYESNRTPSEKMLKKALEAYLEVDN